MQGASDDGEVGGLQDGRREVEREKQHHMVVPDNVVYWSLEKKKVESRRDRTTSTARRHKKIRAVAVSQDFGAPWDGSLPHCCLLRVRGNHGGSTDST